MNLDMSVRPSACLGILKNHEIHLKICHTLTLKCVSSIRLTTSILFSSSFTFNLKFWNGYNHNFKLFVSSIYLIIYFGANSVDGRYFTYSILVNFTTFRDIYVNDNF